MKDACEITYGKSEDSQKVMAIVPCYNEAENIESTLIELKKHNPNISVVVINDGSTDNSIDILRSITGINVIDLPINLGIGGAVQTGFRFFLQSDFDIVLQFDGDGQHPADQISLLVDTLSINCVDMVIGSRFLTNNSGYRSTAARRVGIRWFGKIIRFLTGQKITDATSGFRAYRRKVVTDLVEHYPDDFAEPVSTVYLLRNGYSVCEISVNMKGRTGGVSSLLGWKSAYYMLKVTFALFVAKWSLSV